MRNSEINDLTTKNTMEYFNYSPDNTFTSDELLAGTSYTSEEKLTNFAKNNRKIKKAKNIFFAITLTITGGAIISSLIPSIFNKQVPAISNSNFSLENNKLYYSFTINYLSKYNVDFTITNNEKTLYYELIEKEGSYVNSFDLTNNIGSFAALLSYTDSENTKHILYNYNFTK